ncbi:MotA/TolQ/ExbB proton channel family protein [Geoalkalibacter sp.]|uniref:MotA/TolQ/ExbB proton channel family protein n=1 Tax=Geoalkalibacter sp. TaxID=3041440 RepID=UPI00272E7DA7|nr:MotA/TolQ/ExbB proton channel family protein [Geoalkalibacter sp.]
MYPLLLCSILTVAFGIERCWHYLRAGRAAQAPEQVHALIEKGRFDQALSLAEAAPGPITAVLAEGLRHRGVERELLEEVISLRGASELKRLNQNLHILELVGRIAPLMGLLGTVLGMVMAFRQVAGARGAVDPSLLAGGIWEALITTVAGLCVAIPALILHHFFEDKVDSFAYFMKHYGAEAAKHLGVKG